MTDPYDLDYRGPLNLIWDRDLTEHTCDLHPDYTINADGCAYRRRIRVHLNAQLAARAVEREPAAESERGHVCPTHPLVG